MGVFVLIAVAIVSFGLIFQSSLPILQWEPEGWPKWLVVTLKVLGITILTIFIIVGGICAAIIGGGFDSNKK